MGPLDRKSMPKQTGAELDPGARQLSALIRKASTDSPEADGRIERVRLRLEAGRVAQGRATPRRSWLSEPGFVLTWSSAAAVLGIALLVLVFGGQSVGPTWVRLPWGSTDDSPLSVTLQAHPNRLVGQWVASQQDTKQLRFSDGTQVALSPQTSVRVRETTARGGTVELGQGRALATIRPLPNARWTFLAGPFSVRVTGTAFDLAWDPGRQILELALHEGSVELRGPTLSGRRRVSQGQFVRIDLSSETSVPTAPTPSPTEAPSTSSSTSPDPPPSALEHAAAKKPPSPSPIAPNEQELWEQAQSARLQGQGAVAQSALLALRDQHRKRGQTAFLLGKINADQLGRPGEAIRWFQIYLKEAPGGSFAEQALGRLVELQGASATGRENARAYLKRYPTGPYADLAQRHLHSSSAR